ncbi:unnamed protein product [Prorocentrum cordatum]|uniref:OTU domain-containing protein n=1 Tax=Prorocentrum cordatum TaxID=2364126 RepID=A0ABN9TLU5_9DINO|nr:unnamed protein product [Polarella glacialis]
MAAAMQLALASSTDEVYEACKDPETGVYDFLRHMALRRSYVSVFAVDHQGALLLFDGHKHFVAEGGFTEHTEFVRGLLSDGWLAPLKDEAKGGKKAPGRRRPAPKRSLELQAMLRAPDEPPEPTMTERSRADGARGDAPAPGVVDEAEAPTSVPCGPSHGERPPDPPEGLRPGDGVCIARTGRGWRCERPKKHGDYCAQHAKQVTTAGYRHDLAKGLKRAFLDAARSFRLRQAAEEKAQLKVAIQRSLQDGEAARQRQERSLEILAPRLRERGLVRLETEPLGNCQFLAVARSAGLADSHESLREQACDYMSTLKDMFMGFAGVDDLDYDAYVADMRKDGTWGDELTLTALAHLLMRPIFVISDTTDPAYVLEALPPAAVSRRAWGPEIWVVHQGERHYEATAPAPAPASEENEPRQGAGE